MISSYLTLVLFLMPLTQASWRALPFDGVSANVVDFGPESLSIKVDNSASALLGRLPEETLVRRLEISGTVKGGLNLPKNRLWEKGFDDAFLRVGVIEPGKKRLSNLQRAVAPDWLRQLEDQFGVLERGIGIIRCVELMPEAEWVGKSRINPHAKLFHETIVAVPDGDGAFRMVAEFDPPVPGIGLWLQADGDDTKSAFSVVIKELSISTQEK